MMYRFESRTTQRFIDLGVLSIAYWLAFLLRFDGDIPYLFFKRALFLWPYVTAMQYGVMVVFGVHRFAWRYIGLREATRIMVALGVSSSFLLATRLVVGEFFHIQSVPGYLFIPIGVILIDFAMAFLGVTGVRALRRVLAERAESDRRHRATERVPSLLIGAGQAGMMVAREIARRPDLRIKPVGFVDDDRQKLGIEIHGLKVLGTTGQLPALIEKHEVRQAIITIANAPGTEIRRITNLVEDCGLRAKIIPGIYEILDGRVNLGRIRKVSIEDLLRREVVDLDPEGVAQFIANKRVLVTGAGGSIGSEICRQVARWRPSQLTLVERAEYNLFQVDREIRQAFEDLEVHPCICDVCDQGRLDQLFARFKPEVVFHAAAHKHVPLMEWNPGEAVKNNIGGTQIVANAADRHGAQAFVFVSTDKAVNPTSVMGASKRAAEMYIQTLSARSQTKFVAVRFGNVLGSAGSVVPIFKQQIADGGPVTVTHPDMKRYFMTIPEATELVMEAAAMGLGGEIFVLDMGEPVRIVDLATDLIRLSGLEPGDDIAIEFTGMRPGEKLFEELAFDPEKMSKTRHPKIFVGKLVPRAWEAVTSQLSHLLERAESDSGVDLRALLMEVIEEQPHPDVSQPSASVIEDTPTGLPQVALVEAAG